MNGEIDNFDDEDFDDEVDSSDDDDVSLSDDDSDDATDNVGDMSVEINVEDIILRMEAKAGDDLKRKREIRRRLEEIREAREAAADLDNTFNFNLDEDY
jgi:hypothetical protein